MTLTVTVHAWWLAVYLLVGAVLYVPRYWLSYRHLSARTHPFWTWFRIMHHKDWVRAVVGISLWPWMVKEELS